MNTYNKQKMQTIKVNKAYIPLIEKILKVDNYDKMKAIIDIGFSGIKMIENYYKNSQELQFFNEEIHNYKKQIEKLELLTHNLKLEKNKIEESSYNDSITLKKELESKYLGDLREKSEKIELLNKKISEMKNEFTESSLNNSITLKKELESKYMVDLREKSEKIEQLNKKVSDIKNDYVEKIMKINEETQEKFFNQLKELKEEKNKEIEYFKRMLDESKRNYEETLKKELDKMRIENDKVVNELSKENKRYREKYEKLELKSIKKGIPYENALETELINYFEENNNSYKIERCSKTKGKGDFVITNNYSGIRIMMEAKNMPNVSSTIKEQQPKFYENVKDKTNKYDGGFIIASGRIETKKNYQMEVLEDNKVISFVENYTLNMPNIIMFIIEQIHEKIKELKCKNELSKNEIFEKQIEYYTLARETYKKNKASCEMQEELLKNIKTNILNMFEIDVEEYLLERNNSNKSTKDNISEKIELFIKEEINKNEKIKKKELTNLINKEFKEYIELYEKDKVNGISKRKITNLVKKNLNGEKEIIICT